MEVLKELISRIPLAGWFLIGYGLVLCSVPVWEWIDYKLDVKRHGKETADSLHDRHN